MLPPLYACEFCHAEVDPSEYGVGMLVNVWMEHRKATTPKVYKRSHPHGWACKQCMLDMRMGIQPEAPTLF